MARTDDIQVTVRSYELDVLGHVNNAVYLNWIEQARLVAFERLGFGVGALIDGTHLYNLVRVEIDFRHPTFFGDRLTIGTLLEGIGRTSLTLVHPLVRDADGATVAEARTVIVWLGDDGRPMPVPEEARRALETLDRPGPDPEHASDSREDS